MISYAYRNALSLPCRLPAISRAASRDPAWNPVRGAPIQQLPTPARRQRAQIRNPVARDEHLRLPGGRHIAGPQEHGCPIVTTCWHPHTVIVEPDLVRHPQPDAPVLVKVVHADGRSAN